MQFSYILFNCVLFCCSVLSLTAMCVDYDQSTHTTYHSIHNQQAPQKYIHSCQ
jgi:hypothetical protein